MIGIFQKMNKKENIGWGEQRICCFNLFPLFLLWPVNSDRIFDGSNY